MSKTAVKFRLPARAHWEGDLYFPEAILPSSSSTPESALSLKAKPRHRFLRRDHVIQSGN